MQFADSILQGEAQSSRAFILGDDAAHNVIRLLNVLLLTKSGLSFEDAHADNLVAVIDKLSEKPLQRIVGVSVLVDANHERARPASGLVAFVSDIQSQGWHVVLGSLADGQVVESDMLLKSVIHRHGQC